MCTRNAFDHDQNHHPKLSPKFQPTPPRQGSPHKMKSHISKIIILIREMPPNHFSHSIGTQDVYTEGGSAVIYDMDYYGVDGVEEGRLGLPGMCVYEGLRDIGVSSILRAPRLSRRNYCAKAQPFTDFEFVVLFKRMRA
jgi:hypothetical protein